MTANLLPTLGVPPLLGRLFRPEEDVTNAAGVVVLSYGLWRDSFGAAANVMGTAVILDEKPYTVIGIMPREFTFPDKATRMWTAMRFRENAFEDRSDSHLRVVGRLKPGITLESARAEMNVVAEQIERQFPGENDKHRATVVLLSDEVRLGSLLRFRDLVEQILHFSGKHDVADPEARDLNTELFSLRLHERQEILRDRVLHGEQDVELPRSNRTAAQALQLGSGLFNSEIASSLPSRRAPRNDGAGGCAGRGEILLRRAERRKRLDLSARPVPCNSQFIERLEVQPELRTVPEEVSESKRRIPGDCALPLDDRSDPIRRHSESASEFRSAHVERLQLLSQVFARMYWCACHCVFS